MPGVADPTLLQRMGDRLLHWRIMGVLQRIGIAYLIAGLLTLRTTVKQQVTIIASLLLGYWIVMTVLPVPGEGTIGALLLERCRRARWPPGPIASCSTGPAWGIGNHLWVIERDVGSRRASSRPCRPSARRCSATSPAGGSASGVRSPSGSRDCSPSARSA